MVAASPHWLYFARSCSLGRDTDSQQGTNMTQFTLLYHGVPIGYAAQRADAEHGDPFEFCFLDFHPVAAYSAVRPVIRLASDAFANFGFLGPAAEPASDTAGRAALAAAKNLWLDLELADTNGRPVAGRVVCFHEHDAGGRPSYWLDVEVDDAGASAPAPVPHTPRGLTDYKSPRGLTSVGTDERAVDARCARYY
jgi:hypothetical protein